MQTHTQDKPNRELDRELAEHIAYVHKNGESEEQASAVPLEILRAYIAEVGEEIGVRRRRSGTSPSFPRS